jgi:hypothetical protein
MAPLCVLQKARILAGLRAGKLISTFDLIYAEITIK